MYSKKIIIAQLPLDGFHAFYADAPAVGGTGETECEAIGNLIIKLPSALDLRIVSLNRTLEREDIQDGRFVRVGD